MSEYKSAFRPLRLLKYLFKKPISQPMEAIFDEPRELPANARGYHTNDWDECIGCSTCADICPTEAIIMVDRDELEESDGNFAKRPTIDYGRCCLCALCVDVCTTGSLEMSREYLFNSPDPDDYYLMPTSTFMGKEVKQGYIKDEYSDLLELERVPMDHIAPEERNTNFLEYIKGYSKEQALHEAARCVECGICTKTCPAHMNIPEYIRAIWEDDFEAGVELCYRTNPLSGVCGRICTHNCEDACSLTVRGEAIAIRWLKRYIIDNAPADLYEQVVMDQVSESLDGRVAIIGAGPAGLSAAYYLRTIGYQVDIYEERPLAGGVMRYGIPKYRLPDEAIDYDISFIEKVGVKIHLNHPIDADGLEKLRSEYDVIFTATGHFGAGSIKMSGADHKDVIPAMDFLPIARDYTRGAIDEIDVAKQVVIIGGGNTAFDVARTTKRLGAEVTIAYRRSKDEMPADLEEIIEGEEEGIIYRFGYAPIRVEIEDNKVKGLIVKEVIQINDPDGSYNPIYKDEEILIEAQQVFMATGQSPIIDYLQKYEQDYELKRGHITVGEYGQVAGLPWLFAGGDITSGPDVISAVADGHRAAVGIDEYLSNKAKVQ